MLKKVVVTGANGFLGTSLCKKLIREGVEIFAVVREGTKEVVEGGGNGKVKMVYCNLSEYGKLAQYINEGEIDTLFHFAWAGVNGEYKSSCEVQLANIRAACDIVYACKEMQCQRFVFPATISEYGIYEMMKTECSPPVNSLYHSAKLAADYFVRTIAGGMGIDYIRAVIPSVYGTGFKSGATIFLHESICKLMSGEHCAFTSGEQPYDFVYISDVVEALILLGIYGRANRTYYIGNRPRQLKDFLNEMRDIVAPGASLGFGEIPSSGIVLDYGEFYSEALFKDTGFKPRVAFREGIEKVVEWLKVGMEGETSGRI